MLWSIATLARAQMLACAPVTAPMSVVTCAAYDRSFHLHSVCPSTSRQVNDWVRAETNPLGSPGLGRQPSTSRIAPSTAGPSAPTRDAPAPPAPPEVPPPVPPPVG